MMVLGLAAAAGIVWILWAWSPSLEEEAEAPADFAEDAAPAPVYTAAPEPLAKPSPSTPAPTPQPQQPEPQPDSESEPAASVERIPTPHPMSLDQTKPPEQSGPLAELKHRYASESRSAESAATEAKLQDLLAEARNVPSELVQGISCRRSVCKLELHWTARRRLGFVVVLESFKHMYNQRVAVDPPAGHSEDGTYVTTLYLQHTP
jgi:type IV secretory pathway VirB10-like protein